MGIHSPAGEGPPGRAPLWGISITGRWSSGSHHQDEIRRIEAIKNIAS